MSWLMTCVSCMVLVTLATTVDAMDAKGHRTDRNKEKCRDKVAEMGHVKMVRAHRNSMRTVGIVST